MRDPVQRNVPPRPGGGGAAAGGPGREGAGREAEQSAVTGTMSIGEVLGILKPEFPDITVSKIRFLEGAGLVQPGRSATSTSPPMTASVVGRPPSGGGSCWS